MSDRKVSNELQSAWDDVSRKWSAEVKSSYYSQIYSPMLEESDAVYRLDEDLERTAQECLASLRV
jgi:hypothetical protein